MPRQMMIYSLPILKPLSNLNPHINPELIGNTPLTDLVFLTKNKDFGAYQLRKLRNKSALIAFSISAFVITLVFSYTFIIDAFKGDEQAPIKIKETRVLKYSELSAPPPIELEKPPPEQMSVQSREVKKFIKPVVKPDEEVVDEELIPTVEELETADVGTENIEGLDSLILDEDIASFTDLELEEEVTEPYITVEQMPTFPGGETALLKYLAENVNYPRQAREAKIQGLVIMRFVVDAKGVVSRVEILRGIGGGCDEEAMRVVQNMPQWNPGFQNGRAVPVIYNMPIRFTLIDN